MRKLLAILTVILFIVPLAVAYGVTFYNPAWNPQDGKVFELVEADKPYVFNVKNPDIAITKIVFIIDREAKNGGVTVYNLKSTPDFLPEVSENTSYEFNELKYSGFVPHDTTKFIYEFKVAKGWLENKSVPRNTVALHSYDRVLDAWETLPTAVLSDDDSFVYYTATQDEGVHYLFIGKSLSGTDAESLMPEEEVDEVGKEEIDVPEETKEPVGLSSEITPVQLGDTPSSQPSVAPAATQPVSEPAPETSDDSRLMGALVLIALAVVVLVLYLAFGKKKLGSGVDKELSNYVKESLKRGKSKEEVRNRLLEVGWHHERVDKALAKLSKGSRKPIEKPAGEPEEVSGKNLSMAEAKALAERQKKTAAQMKKQPPRPKKPAKSKKK